MTYPSRPPTAFHKPVYTGPPARQGIAKIESVPVVLPLAPDSVVSCAQLLGDTLYVLNPIDQFLLKNPNASVLSRPGIGGEIVSRTFPDRMVPGGRSIVELGAGRAHRLGGSSNHISYGFGRMLGISYRDTPRPTKRWAYDIPRVPLGAVISPFSFSGKGPNQYPLREWVDTVAYLKEQFGRVVVLDSEPDTPIPFAATRFTASNLYELQAMLASAFVTITIENGIVHLCSTLDYPCVCFWANSGMRPSFAPTWAPQTTLLDIRIHTRPGWMLSRVKDVLKQRGLV